MPSRSDVAVAAGGNARTTTRAPGGRLLRWFPTRWRNRRTTRCRITELPTVLGTTKPARASSLIALAVDPDTSRYTTRVDRPALTPRRIVRAKSSDRVTR